MIDSRAAYLYLAKFAKDQRRPVPKEKPRARRFEGRVSQAKRKKLAALVAVAGGTTCLIPIRTYSESNNRDHYMVKARRVKMQRGAVDLFVRRLDLPPLPVRVVMTRIGKRLLDTDNLVRSLKAVRDAIANVFGVDDGDDRYDWVPMQEIGAEYAVRITVEKRSHR